MSGYNETQFGPGDAVNVLMGCTVVLRYMGRPATDWSYDTAYEHALYDTWEDILALAKCALL